MLKRGAFLNRYFVRLVYIFLILLLLSDSFSYLKLLNQADSFSYLKQLNQVLTKLKAKPLKKRRNLLAESGYTSNNSGAYKQLQCVGLFFYNFWVVCQQSCNSKFSFKKEIAWGVRNILIYK